MAAKKKVAEPEVPVEQIVPQIDIPLKLGFGNPPGKVYVFVGGDVDDETKETYSWYQFNYQAKTRIPIHSSALIGYVKGVRITPKKYKGKWGYKLDLNVVADEDYVIRSGLNTSFSKGIVHSLSLVDDFSKPLAILAVKGDEDKVVFGNLMDVETKKAYIFEGERSEKLGPLVFELQKKLDCQIQSFELIEKEIVEIEASYKQ